MRAWNYLGLMAFGFSGVGPRLEELQGEGDLRFCGLRFWDCAQGDTWVQNYAHSSIRFRFHHLLCAALGSSWRIICNIAWEIKGRWSITEFTQALHVAGC